MNVCSAERTRFAELLRRFYLGRITNFQFENEFDDLSGNDQLLNAVFARSVWGSYNDHREEKFTDNGNRLTTEGRKIVARWILFLKSGQPYKWPISPRLPAYFSIPILFCGVPIALWEWNLAYLSLGILLLIAVGLPLSWADERKMARAGDRSIWPFIDRTDYEVALRHPPYLFGKRP